MEEQALVVAIDDDSFYLEELKRICTQNAINCLCFEGPSEFEEEYLVHEQAKKANLFLVDYDYYNTTALEKDIAGFIRDLGYDGKLLLWTLHEEFDTEDSKALEKIYDGILNKSDLNSETLQYLIAK